METPYNGGPFQEDDEEIVPENKEHIKRSNEYSFKNVVTGIYVYKRDRIRRKIRKRAQLRNNSQGTTSLVEMVELFLKEDAYPTTENSNNFIMME